MNRSDKNSHRVYVKSNRMLLTVNSLLIAVFLSTK